METKMLKWLVMLIHTKLIVHSTLYDYYILPVQTYLLKCHRHRCRNWFRQILFKQPPSLIYKHARSANTNQGPKDLPEYGLGCSKTTNTMSCGVLREIVNKIFEWSVFCFLFQWSCAFLMGLGFHSVWWTEWWCILASLDRNTFDL